MIKCNVYIGGSEMKYEGQYEFENDYLLVEIFNYQSITKEYISIGSDVKYREIKIVDLRNKVFVFSPLFYNVGITFSLMQYEKYRAEFYLMTENVDDSEFFSGGIEISTLTLFHPMLMQCFANPSLQIAYNESEVNYKVIKNSKKKIIEIQKNNIEKIEFGGMCTYSDKNRRQLINIKSENYAKIYFTAIINYEALFAYINEFDVLMNVYCLGGLHSYRTHIATVEGKCFNVKHRLLGKEKYYKQTIYQPVKINYFEYMEKMYKNINYRTTNDRNKYIPLELKKPKSLEDQYIFYFRYIDLYMGEYLKQRTGKEPSNYDRLSTFIDENIHLFDSNDITNIDNLKRELNCLRNQYIHEGYYLPNNQFKVMDKRKKEIYKKNMDHNWLYRIVQVFELGVYKILYTKILSLNIDEGELKNALNFWH